MKKLYLHIGMPKTGTSALQSFFAANREQLCKDGINYPEYDAETKIKEKKSGFSGNALWLEKYALEKNEAPFKNICDQLHESDGDILLSNEFFMFGTDEAIYYDLLKQGFDLKVILSVRRQDTWLESDWNESVKNYNNSLTLNDYIEKRSAGNALNYYEKASRIAAAIGKDNTKILVYQPEQEDIIESFLRILGICDARNYQREKYQVNPSLSANYVEIRRILNGIPGCGRMLENNRDILEQGRSYALQNHKINHAPSFLNKEERQAILEQYHNSNTLLAKEYLGRAALFDETIENCDECGINDETIYADIVSIFGKLAVKQYNKIVELEKYVYKFKVPQDMSGGCWFMESTNPAIYYFAS